MVVPALTDPLRCTHYLARLRLSEGGVVRMVLNLCSALAAAGHHVTLVTAEAGDVPREWSTGRAGLPVVVQLPALRRKVRAGAALSGIRQVLADHHVLHLHTPWDWVNLRFARFAHAANVPYVVTAHGMLDDWSIAHHRLRKSLYLTLAGRRFLERAARVHCTGEVEAAQSAARFPAGRAAVVPLLLDMDAYRELPGPELARRAFPAAAPPGHKVLFISRLVRGKGLELLIDAAALLRDRAVPFTLLIAGEGKPDYRAALERQVAQHRLADRVAFLGMVNGVEKVSLYEAADVVVLASEHENFGFIVPEAMACRTPSVTTRGVGIWPELQRAGATIVEPTASAIADAVEALLSDPGRRRELGERGRHWVMDALAPEKLTRQYEALYRQVIGEAAARRDVRGVGP